MRRAEGEEAKGCGGGGVREEGKKREPYISVRPSWGYFTVQRLRIRNINDLNISVFIGLDLLDRVADLDRTLESNAASDKFDL